MEDDIYTWRPANFAATPTKEPEQAAPASSYSPDSIYSWRPAGLEPDPTPQEYADRAERVGLGLGRSFEEQEDILRKRGFSSEAIKALMGQYKMKTVKRAYEGTVPGGAMEQFARNTLSFGDLFDVRGDKDYHEARKKFESGDQSAQVIDTIARYERLKDIDKNMASQPLGVSAVHTLGGLPKVFGEVWGAGKVVKGLGGLLPGAAGRALVAEEGLRNHAAKMAVMTPLIPSFYLNEARDRNLEAGRSPDDPRGFPGPMLYAYGNLLVLNSLSGNIKGATTASRIAKAGGLGVVEQQGVDAVGGLWDEFAPEAFKTKTRYGLIGQLARGEKGEAGKNAALQFLTFSAFRGVHEFGAKADAEAAKERMRESLQDFWRSTEDSWKRGLSEKAAMEKAAKEAEEKARVAMKYGTPESIARQRDLKSVRDAVESESAREVGPPEPTTEPTTESTGPREPFPRRPISGPDLLARRRAQENVRRAEEIGSRPGTEVEVGDESPTIASEGRLSEVGKTPPEVGIVDPGASGEPVERPRTLRDAVSGREAAPGKPLISPDPVKNIETLNRLLDEKGLTAQERSVILARGDNVRLSEIGRRQGLSRERVRQIEASARAKLGIEKSLDELGFSPSEQAANEAAFRRQSERGEVESAVGPTGEAEAPGVDPKREGMLQKKNDQLNKIVEELGKTTDPDKIEKLTADYEKLSGDIERLESRRLAPSSGGKLSKAIDSAEKSRELYPELEAFQKDELKRAVSNLTPEMRTLVERNVTSVSLHRGAADLTATVAREALTIPGLEPGLRDYYQKILTDVIAGKADAEVWNACYMNGKLFIDGETLSPVYRGKMGEKNGLDVFHTIVHELGHSLDGPGFRKSNHTDWRDGVFEKELRWAEWQRWDRIPNYQIESEAPLTRYAGSDPAEAMAEFTRLCWATDTPTAVIRSKFPKATEYFEDMGWFPPERGPGRGSRRSEVQLPEAFDKKVAVAPDGSHIDFGSRPGTGARSNRPAGEGENVRGMLEDVQNNPEDNVNRLVLADAIQEAGYEKNAEAVRREIDQPPGDKGVSDWRQLHPQQLMMASLTPEWRSIFESEIGVAQREARRRGESEHAAIVADAARWKTFDRYFAEKEAKGERLEFKLPEEPMVGEHPAPQYGPRLYQEVPIDNALELLRDSDFGTSQFDITSDPSGRTPGGTGPGRDTVIEFYSDAMRDVQIDALAPAIGRYDNGIADGWFNVADTAGFSSLNRRLKEAVLSVTTEKGTLRGGPGEAVIRGLVDAGWRRVELPDGRIRLDSPLRQRLRGEQALGVRTGEARFSTAGKLSDLAEKAGLGKETRESIKKFFRGILAGRGDNPQPVYEEILSRDARLKTHAFDVSNAARDLDIATGKAWHRVPEETKSAIQTALTTPDGWKKLPADLQVPTRNMRDKIDAMSEYLKKIGAIPDTLIPAIDANKGVYLTRSFEAFHDREAHAKFIKETPEGQAIVNRFKSWYMEEAQRNGYTPTPEKVNEVVTELVHGDTVADSLIDFFRGSRLGTKDVGILTARKDLPQPLLDLLGEVKDPLANFALTVARQAKLAENHVFQSRIKDLGLSAGFFSATRSESHPYRVAAEGSKGMDVLSDVYASKDVAQALQEAYSPQKNPEWLRAYMKVLALAKYFKTVLSPVAQARNALGNTLLLSRNGYIYSTEAKNAIREILKDTKDGRDYRRRLIELELDESVKAGELRETLKDALGSENVWDLPAGMTDKGIKRALKRGIAVPEGMYRGADLVGKIVSFENEKSNLRRAYPEKSERQIEDEAAAITRDLFPTYSRVPSGIKWLRRFPLVGPFVSFSAEMIRTTKNLGLRIKSELSDPNPEVRKTGAKRLTGLISTLGGIAIMTSVSRLAANITLAEEDAIRRNMPEWSRNGTLLHLGKDSQGNYRVIDLGRTDPHSFLWEPLVAAWSGSRQGTLTPGDVIRPVAAPFIGEEIGTRVALDVARNKAETGGHGQMVYNPEDTNIGKAMSIGSHVWQGFEPGLITQGKRTVRAGFGIRDPKTGREYSLPDELAADVSGQRVIGVNPKESLIVKARSYTGKMSDAAREMNRHAEILRRTGREVTPEAIAGPRAASEEMRQRVFEEMILDVRAARIMGLTDAEIAKSLKDGGVSREDLGAILGGKYRPKPLKDVLRR